jgi:tetratricopeptide (TPR) repeat protein
VLYPHPLLAEGAGFPALRAALALGVLLGVSALALRASRRGRPAALTGWLWFLGTLVPVSGIVQIGWQGLADRYAYVPLIGLLLALVFCAAEAGERALPGAWRAPAAALATAGVCALLAFAARAQLGHWQRSQTLFERAIAVSGANPVMHNELGVLLGGEGSWAQAREHLETAIALAPAWSVPYQNLGSLLRKLGDPAQALPPLERSVALSPGSLPARVALANVLLDLGRADEARAHLEHALAIDPLDPRARLLRVRFEALAHEP